MKDLDLESLNSSELLEMLSALEGLNDCLEEFSKGDTKND